MGLMDSVSGAVGRSAPSRKLRVVREGERGPSDSTLESRAARPDALDEFIGQSGVVFNLTVECKGAVMDETLPDHILLQGPPGLGKTSLAECVAELIGARYVEVPGTALGRVRDAAEALAQIGEPEEGPAVVFVDEIHLACKKGRAFLLSAMERGWFQPSGSEPIHLAPFCLIGATTNPGVLDRPLRQRFGVVETLDYYPEPEMVEIAARYADRMSYPIGEGVAELMASVGRGTPRVMNGLLRRVARFAQVGEVEEITPEFALEALEQLGVDANGMTQQDRDVLGVLVGQTAPLGIETMAAMMDTEEDSIRQCEPYLMRREWLKRTSGNRGRVLTRAGYRALGVTPPAYIPRY